LPWIVVYGFISLMTNPRVLESPLGMADAAIAALANERKAVIHSNDVDSLRFVGLVVENPLK
jgi:hypothetical protein